MTQGAHLFMVRPHLDGLTPATAPQGCSFRTYRPGDEAAWLDIIRRSYGGDLPETAFRRCILADDAFRPERLFFIDQGDQPVGTAAAFQKLFHGDKTGYVHMMAVLAEFRRRGLGTALLRQCLLYFREQGWRDAVLDTDPTHLSAIRLYLGHGFLPFPENVEEMQRWRDVLGAIGNAPLGDRLRLGELPMPSSQREGPGPSFTNR